ncbi:3beta-hydroxysteroid-dehydrogenase/decarboxylase isoform 1 isoform X1 [Carex littledalei]|uniref:Reticulon-like protein n=1 Tax=Carex littledalei TaxID=544730 RepID=A0A833QPR2_9POAL|nr:3beta-hydroxysteroid-dehydrogenase/decarboxylase isoform 1 isoform X1 [Carex littledalei]
MATEVSSAFDAASSVVSSSRGERWCVVTGGRGFAARHLVEQLIGSGAWSVRIADLAPTITLDPHEEEGLLGNAIRTGRAVYASADLRNKGQVIKACEGAEVVFHMAAPDSSINNYQLHYSVNVEGTKNVIEACVHCKVRRLIYTSSPSVLFDGINGIYNADESTPYPQKFNDSYSETKAEGEKLVIKANGREGLLTCCIRPSSIFGPGDKLLVPSLVTAARAGKAKYIIGDGENYYDFTYVENVAYGHICAEKALADEARAKKAAGQAYFITNMEPIKFWEFMSLILEGLGYERPSIKIPKYVMMPVAHLVEYTFKVFSRYGMSVPQLTPSRIRLLTCNRTFSCNKAKDQLGYEPIVTLKEGLRRTVESYPHLKAQKKLERSISKASLYLGNGQVAKTVLWKDKKQSIATLFVLYGVYYHLFSCGYTFTTALAKFLQFIVLFLFIHGMLPSKIFGFNIEKLKASNFEVSEAKANQIAYSIASSWNSLVGILKSICKGEDWSLFIRVVLFLLAVNLAAILSLQTTYKIGVPLMFAAFYMHEKYEDAIDDFIDRALSKFDSLKSNATRKFLPHK